MLFDSPEKVLILQRHALSYIQPKRHNTMTIITKKETQQNNKHGYD